MTNRVRLLIATAALLGLGMALRTAPVAEPATERSLPRVAVIRPERGDVVRSITLPGDLIGRNQAQLYAKVTGYLRRIDVDKGDSVRQGQILAEIEVPELQQKLKRARANRDVRRITYDRLRGVWNTDRRLVAREDVDVARGEFDQAQAEVEELEALVGYTRIAAPFAGIVTARYVDPGALIEADGRGGGPGDRDGPNSGGPIVALADTARLRVYVYVPEREVAAVRRGMAARLVLRELPGREFLGTVARFANALDFSTRTMLTEVDLENPQGELYPGMYADVTLELERHTHALEIPPTAVGSDRTSSFVLVVDGGTLVRVPVTTGIASPHLVEVTSGLSGSESIVRDLGPALREGDRVEMVAAGAATTGAGPREP